MKTLSITFLDGSTIEHPLPRLGVSELIKLAKCLGNGDQVTAVQSGTRLSRNRVEQIAPEGFIAVYDAVIDANSATLVSLAMSNPEIAAAIVTIGKRLETSLATLRDHGKSTPKSFISKFFPRHDRN